MLSWSADTSPLPHCHSAKRQLSKGRYRISPACSALGEAHAAVHPVPLLLPLKCSVPAISRRSEQQACCCQDPSPPSLLSSLVQASGIKLCAEPSMEQCSVVAPGTCHPVLRLLLPEGSMCSLTAASAPSLWVHCRGMGTVTEVTATGPRQPGLKPPVLLLAHCSSTEEFRCDCQAKLKE